MWAIPNLRMRLPDRRRLSPCQSNSIGHQTRPVRGYLRQFFVEVYGFFRCFRISRTLPGLCRFPAHCLSAAPIGCREPGNHHLPVDLEQLFVAAGRGAGRRFHVLPVGLTFFAQAFQRQPMWAAAMAVSTVATLPVALLLVFLQRYFAEGMVMSGLKG